MFEYCQLDFDNVHDKGIRRKINVSLRPWVHQLQPTCGEKMRRQQEIVVVKLGQTDTGGFKGLMRS